MDRGPTVIIFQGAGNEADEILLHIPGATDFRITQAGHDVQQAASVFH